MAPCVASEYSCRSIAKGLTARIAGLLSKTCLSRQHLKSLIRYTVENPLQLSYQLDTARLDHLCNTYLGKNILVTNRGEWSEEKIILAYRSQYLIEDVFKDMKDRHVGNWWPLHHWTDSKIRVHGL